MTVYVRTNNGKTISIKCDTKQKAASTSEKGERKTSIPSGMTNLVHQGKVQNDKKTMEENNIGTAATIKNIFENFRRIGKMS